MKRLAILASESFESGVERIFEIELIIEIFSFVRFAFAHLSDSNQVVDDFAEVPGCVDSPTVQHRFGHVAVLFDCELSDCLTQLLSSQMVR